MTEDGSIIDPSNLAGLGLTLEQLQQLLNQ